MKSLLPKPFCLTSFLAEEGGTELVELALSSVLLFTVVFGIADCARAVYINHYLAQAARDGVHFAMVRGNSWTTPCSATTSIGCVASSSDVKTFVSSIPIPGVVPANMTINTVWPGTLPSGSTCGSTNAQGCLVNVQVNYAFHFTMPFLPNMGWNMSSTSSATIVQ